MFHSVCASSYCLNFDKSPYVRESRTVLDSGFHTVDSGFQLFGFQYLSVELVFWIPIVIRVADSSSCTPDSKTPGSGIHGKNFPDSLTWVEINFMTQFLERSNYFSGMTNMP